MNFKWAIPITLGYTFGWGLCYLIYSIILKDYGSVYAYGFMTLISLLGIIGVLKK